MDPQKFYSFFSNVASMLSTCAIPRAITWALLRSILALILQPDFEPLMSLFCWNFVNESAAYACSYVPQSNVPKGLHCSMVHALAKVTGRVKLMGLKEVYAGSLAGACTVNRSPCHCCSWVCAHCTTSAAGTVHGLCTAWAVVAEQVGWLLCNDYNAIFSGYASEL